MIADVNRGQWTASIIEIIALFFKNQHVDHMEKLLITMDQTAKSDSSEDNESNTSQHLVKTFFLWFMLCFNKKYVYKIKDRYLHDVR